MSYYDSVSTVSKIPQIISEEKRVRINLYSLGEACLVNLAFYCGILMAGIGVVSEQSPGRDAANTHRTR